MSNPLRDTIKQMIDSSIKLSRTTMMTEVVAYNHAGRTIDVKPLGQMGGHSVSQGTEAGNIIKKVSVINSRAIKDEGLQVGDFAYIDFVDSTFTTAVLLNVIKRKIYEDTDRSGATVLKPLSSQAPPVWNKGGE